MALRHVLPLLLLLLLAPAARAAEVASPALLAEYRALFDRYQSAVSAQADERTLRPMKERLDALATALGLAPGEEPAASPADLADAASLVRDLAAALEAKRPSGDKLDALLTLCNGDFDLARGVAESALPASPARTRLLSALQTAAVRREIAGFVSTYDRAVDAARAAYRDRSWLDPIAKLSHAFALWRANFARGKVKASYKAFFNPKENAPYVAYVAEILNELRHAVPYWNRVFHETHLDGFSVPCAIGRGPVDELVFYAIPSPHGMDWESPVRLGLVSGAFNQVTFKEGEKKHLIGHNFISLNRADGRRQLRGMTTTSQTEETDMVLKHGYGYGVLFTDLQGKFDDPAVIQAELDYRYSKGLVTRIRFLLSRETA